MADDREGVPERPARRPLAVRRRVLFGGLYLAYLSGLLWLGQRLFWRALFGTSIARGPGSDEVWDHFFPELRRSGVEQSTRRGEPGAIDVLLLGGSVLQQAEGAIDSALRARFGPGVRLFSLAKSAHTSRDSRLKSKHLENHTFDYVIVYDGINDARMNCCRRSVYRDDYTHCTWYRELDRRLAAGRLTIPELINDAQGRGLALDRPTESELDYGLDVKTGPAFRANIASILARPRHEDGKLVLMTFATSIPPNYNRKEFDAGGFGYGTGAYHLALELWGRPAGVAQAVETHNLAIFELAERRNDVILVDQATLMKPGGTNFCDPCHLTDAGCKTFAKNLVDALS